MSTIIEGLHTCKPKNAPQVGQIKALVAEDKGNYVKLRNPKTKDGETGTNYRILEANQTDYSDSYGNVSFNLKVEEASQPANQTPQTPPQTHQDAPKTDSNGEDGVKVTKAHLAKSANLYNLVVDAAVTLICPHIPQEQRTNEQFQSIVGQLFREVYTKRTDDGVNWYSYVDKMPIKPLKTEAQPDENPLPF